MTQVRDEKNYYFRFRKFTTQKGVNRPLIKPTSPRDRKEALEKVTVEVKELSERKF